MKKPGQNIVVSVLVPPALASHSGLWQSLQAQTFPHFEIIKATELKDDWRNSAAQAAKGTYILPLEQPDALAPTCLEVLVWALAMQPAAFAALWGTLAEQAVAAPCWLLLKTSLFLSNGGFDEQLPATQRTRAFTEKMQGSGHILVTTPTLWQATQNTQAMPAPAHTPPVQPAGQAFAPFAEVPAWAHPPADKRQPHLLFVMPAATGEEATRSCGLLANLTAAGWRITVVLTQAAENNLFLLLQAHTQDLFVLPQFLPPAGWPAFMEGLAITRGSDVLLNVGSTYAYYLVPLLRTKLPGLVITDYLCCAPPTQAGPGYVDAAKAAAPFVDTTFVPGKFSAREVQRRYGRGKNSTQVLYGGVDEELFSPHQTSPGQLRGQLGIAGETPVVLVACNETNVLPLLLNIAALARNLVPDIAFVGLCAGPVQAPLQRAAKQAGLAQTIYTLPAGQDMRGFLRDTDIFLLCADVLDIPHIAYAAMAMQTPVVAGNAGCLPELINEDVGHLVTGQQNVAAAYAQAIAALLANKPVYKSMCKKARRRIAGQFSQRRAQQQLGDTLQALCAAKIERTAAQAGSPACFTPLYTQYLATYAAWLQERENFNYVQKNLAHYKSLHRAQGQPAPENFAHAQNDSNSTSPPHPQRLWARIWGKKRGASGQKRPSKHTQDK